MKVRLLHPERDCDLSARLPWQLIGDIDADLELQRVYDAMAAGDEFLLETAKMVVPLAVTDPDAIIYRQQVLADCIANHPIVQSLYDIAVDGVEVKRNLFLGGLISREPRAILRRAVRMLELLAGNLRQLRGICDAHFDRFHSAGFTQLLTMLSEQLSDDYLHRLSEDLGELNLPRGVRLSAQLGFGNKGGRYLLHHAARRGWWNRLSGNGDRGYGFVVDERDEVGAHALTELEGRALDDTANVVMQSADHVQAFFGRLRTELGFYLGCVNLYQTLTKIGVTTCFPVPVSAPRPQLRCRGLRDIGLCLAKGTPPVATDVEAGGKSLIVITGANEGGKSTFLRGLGAAQVMMQAGMLVTAGSFRADVRTGVFTHFKRAEDESLTRGKFDEELSRMSQIVDFIGPDSMLLCNESFASTNEREGSQIARDIVDVLVETGIKVVFVTHLYDLANSLNLRRNATDLFLRAERRDDGTRTFRLAPGPPEPTSYGEDSFRRVFELTTSATRRT